MYYLYILKCADKTLYAGITTDLERRILEHNETKLGSKYTASRRPVKIVFSKKFKNRSLASKEEIQIKKMKREQKLELIKLNKKQKGKRYVEKSPKWRKNGRSTYDAD